MEERAGIPSGAFMKRMLESVQKRLRLTLGDGLAQQQTPGGRALYLERPDRVFLARLTGGDNATGYTFRPVHLAPTGWTDIRAEDDLRKAYQANGQDISLPRVVRMRDVGLAGEVRFFTPRNVPSGLEPCEQDHFPEYPDWPEFYVTQKKLIYDSSVAVDENGFDDPRLDGSWVWYTRTDPFAWKTGSFQRFPEPIPEFGLYADRVWGRAGYWQTACITDDESRAFWKFDDDGHPVKVYEPYVITVLPGLVGRRVEAVIVESFGLPGDATALDCAATVILDSDTEPNLDAQGNQRIAYFSCLGDAFGYEGLCFIQEGTAYFTFKDTFGLGALLGSTLFHTIDPPPAIASEVSVRVQVRRPVCRDGAMVYGGAALGPADLTFTHESGGTPVTATTDGAGLATVMLPYGGRWEIEADYGGCTGKSGVVVAACVGAGVTLQAAVEICCAPKVIHVRDPITLDPIVGATVRGHGPDQTTDASGNATIAFNTAMLLASPVPDPSACNVRTPRISVSAMGYIPFCPIVTVECGASSSTATVDLEPLDQSDPPDGIDDLIYMGAIEGGRDALCVDLGCDTPGPEGRALGGTRIVPVVEVQIKGTDDVWHDVMGDFGGPRVYDLTETLLEGTPSGSPWESSPDDLTAPDAEYHATGASNLLPPDEITGGGGCVAAFATAEAWIRKGIPTKSGIILRLYGSLPGVGAQIFLPGASFIGCPEFLDFVEFRLPFPFSPCIAVWPWSFDSGWITVTGGAGGLDLRYRVQATLP